MVAIRFSNVMRMHPAYRENDSGLRDSKELAYIISEHTMSSAMYLMKREKLWVIYLVPAFHIDLSSSNTRKKSFLSHTPSEIFVHIYKILMRYECTSLFAIYFFPCFILPCRERINSISLSKRWTLCT